MFEKYPWERFGGNFRPSTSIVRQSLTNFGRLGPMSSKSDQRWSDGPSWGQLLARVRPISVKVCPNGSKLAAGKNAKHCSCELCSSSSRACYQHVFAMPVARRKSICCRGRPCGLVWRSGKFDKSGLAPNRFSAISPPNKPGTRTLELGCVLGLLYKARRRGMEPTRVVRNVGAFWGSAPWGSQHPNRLST